MANPDPEITFEVDLTLRKTEQIGPNTNARDVRVLHPDRHTSYQDMAITSIDQRQDHLSAALSGLNIRGLGHQVKHGDQFTLYGMDAIYVRDMYSNDGPSGEAKSMAVLKVV